MRNENDDASMENYEHEVCAADALRDRMFRAVNAAIDKLVDAATGNQDSEVNDAELRACIVLARLAPVLIGTKSVANDRDDEPWRHTPECPRHLTPEEGERMLAELEALG